MIFDFFMMFDFMICSNSNLSPFGWNALCNLCNSIVLYMYIDNQYFVKWNYNYCPAFFKFSISVRNFYLYKFKWNYRFESFYKYCRCFVAPLLPGRVFILCVRRKRKSGKSKQVQGDSAGPVGTGSDERAGGKPQAEEEFWACMCSSDFTVL